jgi:hypothetical protein
MHPNLAWGKAVLLNKLLRGAVTVALVFAISWSVSGGGAAAQERPSDAFKASTTSLLPSFFRVNASFTSCNKREKVGFAFVVGEGDDKLFLAVCRIT